MKKYDIAVIGAGASGMMAAIAAARQSKRVVLLEKNDRVGKKLLSTGNGKCNFTNKNQDISCYHTECPGFVVEIFKQFSMEDTISFFEELGVLAREKNGYYYPRSEQAASIPEALFMELKRLDVLVLTEQKSLQLIKRKEGFLIKSKKEDILAEKLILSCGTKASRISGADGSGYDYAKQFGHSLIPVVPALTALHTSLNSIKKTAGVRCQGKVSLYADGEKLAEEMGEIQFTAYGISGIVVFQLSRFASYALREQKNVSVEIDFFVEKTEWEVLELLKKRQKMFPDRKIRDFFLGMFPSKLAVFLLEEASVRMEGKASELSKKQLQLLVRLIKGFLLPVTKTNSFEEAQVCAGGVDLRELTGKMESNIVPGLYFTGELTDVDGICGGYNLQWAWSSGYVAGMAAAKNDL